MNTEQAPTVKPQWADRFWAKVGPPDANGCMNWTACKTGAGYGQLGVNGRPSFAHRLAFELAGIPLPIGHDACHKCDNPSCVNIEHLFAGTRGENMRDMVAKGRHWMSSAPEKVLRGQRHYRSTQSDETIRAILTHKGGPLSQSKVGELFNVKRTYVCDVWIGRTRQSAATI